MVRLRLLLVAPLLLLALSIAGPADAWAHGAAAHSHTALQAGSAPDDGETAGTVAHEADTAAVSSHVDTTPEHEPLSHNGSHCAACNGCCHAPALRESFAESAPFFMKPRMEDPDDVLLALPARSTIENPPKSFA
jgi:hypothetical protein